MSSWKKALLYGVLVWVIPFVVAIFIYPIRTNDRALFESIMPVVLTLSVVSLTTFYFEKTNANFLREGIIVGVVWLGISLALDLLMFVRGPINMSLNDYLKDIGLTYLIIPTITVGLGFILGKKTVQNKL